MPILEKFSYLCVGNSPAQLKFKFMVKQKLISVKVNIDQLEKLDRICLDYGIKRNSVINLAISFVNNSFCDKKHIQGSFSSFSRVAQGIYD